LNLRDATPAELEGWDARTVDVPGGHVYQSLAWAEHRRSSGWAARHLVGDDDAAVLVLTRAWPWIGGGSAYIPRGPIAPAGGGDVAAASERLLAVSDHLARSGIDVVASDAEIEAETGYGERIRVAGFGPIPEIQPSRHRMSLALPAGSDDDTIRGGIGKSTRQRIKAAEGSDLTIARYDTAGWAGDGTLFDAPARPLDEVLDTFYDLLAGTGGRRGFSLGPRRLFVPWWRLAHEAGHLVHLEALDGPTPVGGLLLYRHGTRLSTVHSGDAPGARDAHPGVMHLLRWRAIQLALREGRTEMDLGGVDTGPAHRLPGEGEPMHGLYEHKRSFGATWVEMTGAHERVIRPWRYALGRLTARGARIVRR